VAEKRGKKPRVSPQYPPLRKEKKKKKKLKRMPREMGGRRGRKGTRFVIHSLLPYRRRSREGRRKRRGKEEKEEGGQPGIPIGSTAKKIRGGKGASAIFSFRSPGGGRGEEKKRMDGPLQPSGRKKEKKGEGVSHIRPYTIVVKKRGGKNRGPQGGRGGREKMGKETGSVHLESG